MTVRVGIIGVGVMGSDHARTLVSNVPDAELRALCDADLASAKAVADETGAKTAGSDPLAIINDPAIDAVLIASPDNTHRDLTLACLAAQKPVLCEKPLAPTAKECLDIVAAETRAGRRIVQIGYMRRFDPAYVEMKEVLRSGQLGRALMLHCFHRNVSAPPWFDAGMAITNSAVHEFDIARWVLEAEFISVHVFRPGASATGGVGFPVFLVLETSAGQLVNVETFNNAAYGYDVRGELVCEKGTVSLRSPVNSETSHKLIQSLPYPSDWRARFATAYRVQMQAWIRSVLTESPTGASAWDGYAAAAVAEAGLASLAECRSIAIVLNRRPALYG
jgi:myo-inositol 2-dehydrogenase / D-chiro-inositol 1-dehydrogenase